MSLDVGKNNVNHLLLFNNSSRISIRLSPLTVLFIYSLSQWFFFFLLLFCIVVDCLPIFIIFLFPHLNCCYNILSRLLLTITMPLINVFYFY